jgi:ferritin-like protein
LGSSAFLPRTEEQAGRTGHVPVVKESGRQGPREYEACQKLVERIAELGANKTGDPTEFVMLSPLKRFSMPSSNSDVYVILGHILELERSIIRTYGDFLHSIRDKDDLTHHLIREILEDEIRRESEIEAALASDMRPHLHAK